MRRLFLALTVLSLGCAAAQPDPPSPQPRPVSVTAPTSAPATTTSAPATSASALPEASLPAPVPHDPPTEEDWARITLTPLPGAADRGCTIRILGARGRITCPIKSPDGAELLEVQAEGEFRVENGTKSVTLLLWKNDEKDLTIVWASDVRNTKIRAGVPVELKKAGAMPAAVLKQFRRAAECCAKEESAEECAAPFYRIPEQCEKFLSDCKRVNACARMDFDPRCPAGQINQDGRCRKLCDPKKTNSCNIQEDQICIVTGLSPKGRHVCVDQH